MTDSLDPALIAAREAARQSAGRFGAQDHTAPGDLLACTLPQDVTYGVYEDGKCVSEGVQGAGMDDALNRARAHANTLHRQAGQSAPVLTIRSEGSGVEVRFPYGDDGRIVGWHRGEAVAAEEMDGRGISLAQCDSVSTEPFIDMGRYGEGDLQRVEELIRGGDFDVSMVYASRDEETGGYHVDISVNENFLWDADTQCPDDEYDDDTDLDPDDSRPASTQRYEAWLDQHRDVVEEVYLEWFNADIDLPETWDYATVTLRKPIPPERFTESLVVEDVWPLLVDHANQTDPGTFGSPYVMGEVRRRVQEREQPAHA